MISGSELSGLAQVFHALSQAKQSNTALMLFQTLEYQIRESVGNSPGSYSSILFWVGHELLASGQHQKCLNFWEEAHNHAPRNEFIAANLMKRYVVAWELERARDIARQFISSSNQEVARLALETAIFAIAVLPSQNFDELNELARIWFDRFVEPIRVDVETRRFEASRGPEIRVGFMHAHFSRKAYQCQLIPIFKQLRRLGVAVYGYAADRAAVPREMVESATAWRSIAEQSTSEITERILSDNVDILVNLDGFSPGARLSVFAQRPAPILVTWLNTHHTYGGPLFDYIIADQTVLPEAERSAFQEKIFDLPDCYFCMSPLEGYPEVMETPARANGYITFGSFNRPEKLGAETVACWGRILRGVPNARLLLRNTLFSSGNKIKEAIEKFESVGVDGSRLTCLGHEPNNFEFLKGYSEIDIALDPTPFSGGMTTFDALWQGVPVVALNGTRWSARASASMLRAAGLGQWVAEDWEQYHRLALDLASDIDALDSTRQSLRSRILGKPLTDSAQFALNLRNAFMTMLQQG